MVKALALNTIITVILLRPSGCQTETANRIECATLVYMFIDLKCKSPLCLSFTPMASERASTACACVGNKEGWFFRGLHTNTAQVRASDTSTQPLQSGALSFAVLGTSEGCCIELA